MVIPTAADVAAAAERIRPHVRRTPVLKTSVDGRPVVFKLEQLQRTGSFKLRGATNALLAGPRPERVVTASGGNHGLAVATAASALGIPVTVHMPAFVPPLKADRMRAAGAELVRHEEMSAVFAAALAEGQRPRVRYLPPFDDPHVIAGQGTATAELLADAPEVDTVVVAVGGGGLLGGAVLAAGGRSVVAVEPHGACCLHQALAAGEPVESTVDSVAASALGATRFGDLPFELLRKTPAVSVLVSDEQILAARDRLWEEFRLAVEPGGAAGLAAVLAGQVDGDLPGIVLCGANTAWTPAD